jgi:putative ABC transport system permease protein
VLTDLIYAGRRMLRTPSVSLTAFVSFAIGIGVNSTLFGLVNGVLFKPLPIFRPDALISISLVQSGRVHSDYGLNAARFAELRRRRPLGDGLIGVAHRPIVLGTDTPKILMAEATVGPFFEVLRPDAPLMGRYFGPDERGVLVLSFTTWVQDFGKDGHVVGRQVLITGQPFVVVGVAPQSFRGLTMPTLVGVGGWIPADSNSRREGPFRLFARLQPDMTFERARAAVISAGHGIDPGSPSIGLDVIPASRALMPEAARLVGTFAAVAAFALGGLVLFSAGANLIYILLADLSTRLPELATRSALGAQPSALARMVLAEASLVTCCGVVTGFSAGYYAARLVATTSWGVLGGFEFKADLTPDYRVITFGLTLLLLAVWSVSGVVIANLRRLAPARILNGGRSGLPAIAAPRRKLFVALQIGASTVVLLLAALLIRSTQVLGARSPVFDRTDVVTARFDLGLLAYSEQEGTRFYDELARIANLQPGVSAAALASELPERGHGDAESLGRPGAAWTVPVHRVIVSPHFFGILGLPILAGRDFSDHDRANASLVAVVSQSFAERQWSTAPAVGQRFDLDVVDRSVEVVGIVADADPGAAATDRSVVYVPSAQHYSSQMLLLAQGPSETMLKAELQNAAQLADRAVPVIDITPLRERWGLEIRSARLSARLLGAFGCCALALAVTGIYGLTSYVVSGRARELRIRKALGAAAGDIYRLILREMASVVAGGLLFGLLVGELFAWTIRRALWQVSPMDVAAVLFASATVVVITLAASLLATRRLAGESTLGLLRNL